MKEINSWFIGWFKVWDNINYNLKVLNKLYSYYNSESEEEKQLLLKPIVILIVSIIEALLDDFFFRIYAFTKEWIENLDKEKLLEIRKKKYEKFETFIAWSKKHDLFKSDELFYNELHYLRDIRNKIHIQLNNVDEDRVFTEEEKEKAEKMCENIMIYLSKNHLRWEYQKHVDDFKLPW